MNLTEEKNLVKKARKDPEAFGKIFDLHYTTIFSYILRRVANVEIAKDIVSEVFFKAFKNIWRFKWRNISILTWLYRIATNEVNYYYRKKKYRTVSLDRLISENGFDPSNSDTIEQELIEAEENLQKHAEFLEIHNKVLNLPLKYQEVLSFKLFEEKSNTEISKILGKKEGTVRSLISRGLTKLRE